MKILLIHNSYQESGGEEAVVAAEAHLLESNGHTVIPYFRSNDELRGGGWLESALAGVNTTWSSEAYREISDLIARWKPEVAHFHNTFPLISPAAYIACQSAGVPVVQTLHNYRMLCPGATFFRDGKVCQDCLGRGIATARVLHACYRNSRAATAATTAMLATHHLLQTWKKEVDIYIALSDFARSKFIEGGFPAERIIVKRNAISSSPAPKDNTAVILRCMLAVSRKKKACAFCIPHGDNLTSSVPLKIAGDGPLREEVASEIAESGFKHVDFLGRIAPGEIFRVMRERAISNFSKPFGLKGFR